MDVAQKISDNYQDDDWIFLYSGLDEKNSYLSLFPRKKIICEDFSAAKKILKDSKDRWFGYLSYEVAHDFEKFPKTKKSFINLPRIYLVNFDLVFEFDHKKKKLVAIFRDKKLLEKVIKWTQKQAQIQKTKDLSKNYCAVHSNFTDPSYLKTISKIKKLIARGDLYQTNLTRKFFGEFKQKQNQRSAFQTFLKLTKISPANYSSFLKLGEDFIISSSPELFFQIKNRKIISRPIKGTAPRGSSSKLDHKNKLDLKNSLKERAENLMIVDLVRNDLARICKAGSVFVKKLFNITTYKTIHHMSSEIHGELRDNASTLDALEVCFPAGSMTGAPKIKAMEIAAKNEKINRGIYSGAIGFIDQKSANFSVVIRTLILSGKKFEFQTGGAITFDSDPQKELEEIYSKAKALMAVVTN
ncbi:MAG: aminodeoxychorismate synthase component I [Proteobacteria bacterium]|nr:aminodeoxychorismate synthase component I [Pseudomonadota bacterium]